MTSRLLSLAGAPGRALVAFAKAHLGATSKLEFKAGLYIVVHLTKTGFTSKSGTAVGIESKTNRSDSRTGCRDESGPATGIIITIVFYCMRCYFALGEESDWKDRFDGQRWVLRVTACRRQASINEDVLGLRSSFKSEEGANEAEIGYQATMIIECESNNSKECPRRSFEVFSRRLLNTNSENSSNRRASRGASRPVKPLYITLDPSHSTPENRRENDGTAYPTIASPARAAAAVLKLLTYRRSRFVRKMIDKHGRTIFVLSLCGLVVAIIMAAWGFPEIVKKQIQKHKNGLARSVIYRTLTQYGLEIAAFTVGFGPVNECSGDSLTLSPFHQPILSLLGRSHIGGLLWGCEYPRAAVTVYSLMA
ncbi:Sensory neuron membrane protein 2 [Eumeta japonica]|uniref:Sensory neuron membrane protein 2 n=1 Tax=Eumeta variegata TaxID=151549 RepID=A0A4C1WM13_EUMVA|nr:Sensory neuron membrane protein 2 [Eumeta japonica]